MDISILTNDRGTFTLVVDEIEGWHIPLTIRGEYQPAEPAENCLPAVCCSFDIDEKCLSVHAADGDGTEEDPDLFLKVNISSISRELISEIESDIADYIENSIEQGAIS